MLLKILHFFTILIFSFPLFAQDIQNFNLASDKFRYFNTDYANTIKQNEFNFSSYINYGNRPLIEVIDTKRIYLVDQLTNLTLISTYGILDTLQASFQISYGWSTGTKPKTLDSGSGLNNFKFNIKYKLPSFHQKLKLALLIPNSIPVEDKKIIGSTAFTTGLKSIVSYDFNNKSNASLNLGYSLRFGQTNEYSLDNNLTFGIGYLYTLNDSLSLKTDIYGRYFLHDNILPIETLIGINKKINNGTHAFDLAIGRGLTTDYSSVSLRILLSLSIIYGLDSDNDSFYDSSDYCPQQPETINDYKDHDGCPDSIPDQDYDNIPDIYDPCPLLKEDNKGILEGCPEKPIDELIIPDTVYFEKDTPNILPKSISFLTNLSKLLESSQKIKLLIQCSGTLSNERCSALKKLFINLDVSEDNILIESLPNNPKPHIEFKFIIKTKTN